MASNNRATQINKVFKAVRKHYKPVEPHKDRSVLEHLLFACCLENSLFEESTKVVETLSKDYFDWNEVRVTSIRELAEVMKPLNDPEDSATRLKRVLQSVFESHYSFDLEPMRKQNIGQAVKQLEKYNGVSPFTVAYVTQNALGGHSIPVNQGLLRAMLSVGVVSEAEAAKNTVPGLERAVPKTRGFEISSLLHQLGVELHRSPYGPVIRKLLLEIEPKCKDRLPKRPTKKEETQGPEPSAPAPAVETAAKKSKQAKAAEKVASAEAAAPAKKQKTDKKVAAKPSPDAGKAKPIKNSSEKKAPQQKTKSLSKDKKKTSTKRLTKRKPR